MIILPDRNVPRARVLMPMPAKTWRAPSQARPKDYFGRENQTRFRVRARLNDGHVAWCGWFDDREDFDAFLWAIATGSLQYEPALWRLPSPWWDPDFGDLTYDFVSVTYLTTTSSPFTSPSDWDNATNTVECVGAGASGGCSSSSAFCAATGGGGGCYGAITTFVFATPGTTTAAYQIGAGGTSVTRNTAGGTNGVDGGSTWWNNGSDPGVGSDNTKCSGQGGKAGVGAITQPQSGGAGGATASSWGTTKFAGGRGGNITANATATGGGGAGGSDGAGNPGADVASGNTGVGGGSSDAGSDSTGTAGAGATGTTNQTGGNGGNGTRCADGVHGFGGGGGGALSTTAGASATGGNGGNYGGGGGGGSAKGTGNTGTSGVGIQGMIVVTYTPVVVSTLIGSQSMFFM